MRSMPCLRSEAKVLVTPAPHSTGSPPLAQADTERWCQQLQEWRNQLDTRFPEVPAVFESCMAEACRVLTPDGVNAYIQQARFLGKMGRGVEPLLIFLAEWPEVARLLGEDALPQLAAAIHAMWKSPNGKAITPFLQSLPAVARRLPSPQVFGPYLAVTLDLMERTTGSIHGHHTTFPSPGLPFFLEQAPHLLQALSTAGMQRWVDYGVRNHQHHPERQREYFSLQSADARAVLQRERRGTLLADQTRALNCYLRALWQTDAPLIPFATQGQSAQQPYVDAQGFRLPDVLDDRAGVSALDRYRLALAHMAGHQRWSQPQVADNWSPMQRMAVEVFEDARIDTLLLRVYPGLRAAMFALHPHPDPGACDETRYACLRHRLAMVSRALLDDQHGYTNVSVLQAVEAFQQLLAESPDGQASTQAVADLALRHVARTRRQSDQQAEVFFDGTEVDYRDDNRHLWIYLEEGDEEESFEDRRHREPLPDVQGLPPRHYPEWDFHTQTHKPDWVSLYERLHPSGNPADIDRILLKHCALAKQLQRLLDLLKPQDKVRVRYQEEGSELDLDVALRSLIDHRSGATPDLRIHMSHRTDGRDIAVLLLLDLSESLNDPANGGADQASTSVLHLSREAVTLLAWAIEKLGDKLAIAGFHSNTRHDVRYHHIKGFSEPFDGTVKARLAGMEAAFSTRMGAAMRHAGHYLRHCKADKKLMLVLTDGQPSDIDVPDERQLIEDARQAVLELDQHQIYTHCISLDPKADAYVSDIFDRRFTVIDHVQRLPERLPKLFMSLTR